LEVSPPGIVDVEVELAARGVTFAPARLKRRELVAAQAFELAATPDIEAAWRSAEP
jgi:hypothetical protein